MIITDLKCYNDDKLINKLRNVTMLKNPSIKPYENSYITIENIDPLSLYPCQFYILKNELDLKIELQEAFDYNAVNIFNIAAGRDDLSRKRFPVP